jgi:hypothetical protein
MLWKQNYYENGNETARYFVVGGISNRGPAKHLTGTKSPNWADAPPATIPTKSNPTPERRLRPVV